MKAKNPIMFLIKAKFKTKDELEKYLLMFRAKLPQSKTLSTGGHQRLNSCKIFQRQ